MDPTADHEEQSARFNKFSSKTIKTETLKEYKTMMDHPSNVRNPYVKINHPKYATSTYPRPPAYNIYKNIGTIQHGYNPYKKVNVPQKNGLNGSSSSANYIGTNQHGYINNPYKKVNVPQNNVSSSCPSSSSSTAQTSSKYTMRSKGTLQQKNLEIRQAIIQNNLLIAKMRLEELKKQMEDKSKKNSIVV